MCVTLKVAEKCKSDEKQRKREKESEKIYRENKSFFSDGLIYDKVIFILLKL